jgi:hypothetical protein
MYVIASYVTLMMTSVAVMLAIHKELFALLLYNGRVFLPSDDDADSLRLTVGDVHVQSTMSMKLRARHSKADADEAGFLNTCSTIVATLDSDGIDPVHKRLKGLPRVLPQHVPDSGVDTFMVFHILESDSLDLETTMPCYLWNRLKLHV